MALQHVGEPMGSVSSRHTQRGQPTQAEKHPQKTETCHIQLVLRTSMWLRATGGDREAKILKESLFGLYRLDGF